MTWSQSTTRFRDPVGAVRMAQFVDALSRFPVGHLVDLGAGHGIFSLLAADLGWKVTAVDVRDERFGEKDPRVRWVVSDVREFDEYDDVTVVANLGLWYHLTLEDQVQLAKKIAPRPLILDTHIAMPKVTDHHPHTPRMSDLVQDNGYEGRLYSEEGLQHAPTASWGNEFSFWPTLATLEKQMYDAGYDVFEQVSPPHSPDRRYFVVRSLGTEADLAKLDQLLAPYNEVEHPQAAPAATPLYSRSVSASDQVAAPAPAPAAPAPAPAPAPAAKNVPLDVATAQFATSLTRVAGKGARKAVRKARQLRNR